MSPSRIVTLGAVVEAGRAEILMLSGIFSAVRIWSERAVTTLLHLTLAAAAAAADTVTGWGIISAKMKKWLFFCDPFLDRPVVLGPFLPSFRDPGPSFKTNGPILASL